MRLIARPVASTRWDLSLQPVPDLRMSPRRCYPMSVLDSLTPGELPHTPMRCWIFLKNRGGQR